MDVAEQIARGEQPYWKETFKHPDLGDLTFEVASLPKTRDWLAHAVAQEALAPGLRGLPGELAAAVAAMNTFMKVPVVAEDREEDPDDPDHITIKRVYYDALEDEHVEFVVQVWASFWNWRVQALSDDTREQVKNSSGVTSGAAAGDSLPATTDSPQPTPA